MLWCCTQRTCVSGAVTAFTRVLSAPRNIRKLAISVPAARWINAPSAPAALTLTAARKNLKSTAITVWRKASCRCAQKCARPNRYSPAIAMSSPRSTRSAYRSVATAPVLGVGKLPTKNRLRRDVSHTVQHLLYSRLIQKNTRNAGRRTHGETCCAYALDRGRVSARIHCRNDGFGFGPAAESGQSECRCGEGATIAPAAQNNRRPRHYSGRKVLRARAPRRSQLAGISQRDAALDWRDRHLWHAGDSPHLLSVARHGDDQERTFGS